MNVITLSFVFTVSTLNEYFESMINQFPIISWALESYMFNEVKKFQKNLTDLPLYQYPRRSNGNNMTIVKKIIHTKDDQLSIVYGTCETSSAKKVSLRSNALLLIKVQLGEIEYSDHHKIIGMHSMNS